MFLSHWRGCCTVQVELLSQFSCQLHLQVICSIILQFLCVVFRWWPWFAGECNAESLRGLASFVVATAAASYSYVDFGFERNWCICRWRAAVQNKKLSSPLHVMHVDLFNTPETGTSLVCHLMCTRHTPPSCPFHLNPSQQRSKISSIAHNHICLPIVTHQSVRLERGAHVWLWTFAKHVRELCGIFHFSFGLLFSNSAHLQDFESQLPPLTHPPPFGGKCECPQRLETMTVVPRLWWGHLLVVPPLLVCLYWKQTLYAWF